MPAVYVIEAAAIVAIAAFSGSVPMTMLLLFAVSAITVLFAVAATRTPAGHDWRTGG